MLDEMCTAVRPQYWGVHRRLFCERSHYVTVRWAMLAPIRSGFRCLHRDSGTPVSERTRSARRVKPCLVNMCFERRARERFRARSPSGKVYGISGIGARPRPIPPPQTTGPQALTHLTGSDLRPRSTMPLRNLGRCRSRLIRGNRSSSISTTIRPSRRASAAPRQW